MKINEARLKSETKKLEEILGRKQFKRGYENEFQNVTMYDQILYSIGATPTYAAEKIFTPQQMQYINKMMDRGLIQVCDFYNRYREIIHNGLNSFEETIRRDDTLEILPIYQLNGISEETFNELLLQYFSQYGENVYKIIKKYIDEERIELGDSLDPSASGIYFGSNLNKSGYITIQRRKKLNMFTLGVLSHELGHAIDFETLHYPQQKNMNLVSDLLIEVPSIHFELGFYDFLLENNIYPNDARSLINSIYQELSAFAKSFDALFNMDDFFIEDGGYVTNMDGKFVDYEGKEIEESEEDEEECDCCSTQSKAMDITEVLKYGLGMYIALQTNELAKEDRRAYIKRLLSFTTQRK